MIINNLVANGKVPPIATWPSGKSRSHGLVVPYDDDNLFNGDVLKLINDWGTQWGVSQGGMATATNNMANPPAAYKH